MSESNKYDRRNFLKRFSTGAVAVAITPSILGSINLNKESIKVGISKANTLVGDITKEPIMMCITNRSHQDILDVDILKLQNSKKIEIVCLNKGVNHSQLIDTLLYNPYEIGLTRIRCDKKEQLQSIITVKSYLPNGSVMAMPMIPFIDHYIYNLTQSEMRNRYMINSNTSIEISEIMALTRVYVYLYPEHKPMDAPFNLIK